MMNDLANPAEPISGSQKLPAIAIIEDQVLARTCIVKILKRELTGFEIVEMATTSDIKLLSGRDVRLIAFHIGDKQITDPSIEDGLALIEESCPNAFITLLSNRDDEATASAAMQRGVRGFFSSSIAVEVALAGLRLVLAGGVYEPLPIIRRNEATSLRAMSEYRDAPERSLIHEGAGAANIMPERTLADLTPREQHVLAALKLGLPINLIAVRLNLSDNTVKKYIRHIMRKMLRWN
jgi:DNA-binding NarL/FixJ family response regulator